MKTNLKTLIKSLTISAALAVSASANADILLDWHGSWQGECRYQEPGSIDVEYIPMTIEISPVSANEVSWNMHYYRSSGDIIKNYTLRLVDEATGHYVMDENNGILIDEYLRQNHFLSNFVVNKRHITTNTELNDNVLTYHAYAFGTSPIRRSKKTGVSVYGDPAFENCTLMR